MASESTAINQLIHLVQAKRLEVDEDPVPDLFAVPPSRPALAPARVATGTRPPPVATPAPVSARPAPPIAQPVPQAQARTVQPLPAMPAQQYRIPTVVHHDDDDEQTEMWNNSALDTAALDTSPPVPRILPNVATMLAPPPQARAVPAILRGPIAPQAPVAAAPHAPSHPSHPSHPSDLAQPSRPAHPAQLPYAHVVLPLQAYAVSPGFPAPVVPPIAPPAPAPYLVARELLSSAIRSRGGIAALAAIALAVGVYLAIASRGEDKPQAPTDRDRAIAIMNGTAQPDPPSVKAPAPAEPVVVIAPEPTSPITAEPIATAPTSEPIEPSEPSEPPTESETSAADPEPLADEVALDDIEMEPIAARPSRRAARSSRVRKTVAIVAQPVSTRGARTARTNGDPVLAILAEKPAKAGKPAKSIDKPAKLVSAKNLVATEIAAPRGAAAAKGTGKVTITSDRAALVFLDGRPTGKSAPTALVIPAGDHQITLLDPASKKAKTATIQLVANKAITIQKRFD